MAERMKRMYPFIDLVFGTHNMHRLPEYLYQVLKGRHPGGGSAGKRRHHRRGPAAKAREPLLRLCQHHVWLQQLLLVLHRALCARTGALARTGGGAGGVQAPCRPRCAGDYAAGAERQFLPRRRQRICRAFAARGCVGRAAHTLHDLSPQGLERRIDRRLRRTWAPDYTYIYCLCRPATTKYSPP